MNNILAIIGIICSGGVATYYIYILDIKRKRKASQKKELLKLYNLILDWEDVRLSYYSTNSSWGNNYYRDFIVNSGLVIHKNDVYKLYENIKLNKIINTDYFQERLKEYFEVLNRYENTISCIQNLMDEHDASMDCAQKEHSVSDMFLENIKTGDKAFETIFVKLNEIRKFDEERHMIIESFAWYIREYYGDV